MDPMVALPCVDGANPTFFGKPVFVDDGHHQFRRRLRLARADLELGEEKPSQHAAIRVLAMEEK